MVSQELGLGSTSTSGVERGGMSSWRSMAEPRGGVRGRTAAQAASWVGNSAREQGKVQEEVRCPWRRQWGLEIINQGRGQPIGAMPASCPHHRLPGRRQCRGACPAAPFGEHHVAAAHRCSGSGVLPRGTARTHGSQGSAEVLSPIPVLGHISRKGFPGPASSRDTTWGTLPHCRPNLHSPRA